MFWQDLCYVAFLEKYNQGPQFDTKPSSNHNHIGHVWWL